MHTSDAPASIAASTSCSSPGRIVQARNPMPKARPGFAAVASSRLSWSLSCPTQPMSPRPPAALTAPASAPPETPAIGAETTGTCRSKRSVSHVLSTRSSSPVELDGVSASPLIPRPWRPLALLSWLGAAAVLSALSWHFAHGPTTNRPDAAVGSRLQARLAAHPHLLSMAARLGSPTVVVGGAVVLALFCWLARRPKAAVFAFVAAPAAGFVTEYLLKPAVHREQHVNALLFPSGHTTGAFALALTVVVLLLPHEGTRLFPALARMVVGIAALAVAGLVAVAVVALGWHYVTDAVGGVVTAVVVVLGLAATLDIVWRRRVVY